LLWQGDLHVARSLHEDLVAEAEAERAPLWKLFRLAGLGITLAFLGKPAEARAAGEASIAIGDDLGGSIQAFIGYESLAYAAMACGDPSALREATQAGLRRIHIWPDEGTIHRFSAEADLALGELPAARQHADEAMTLATRPGMFLGLMQALLASARVAAAASDIGRAHDDAYQALIVGHGIRSRIGIVDALELLGGLAQGAESQLRAARLLGAADALRQETGYRRFLLYQDGYDAAALELRSSLGDAEFEQAFAEGAVLTSDEAVNYALRGRGQRGRPAAGWLALTPAERDVARLVAEGLANREIADKLFVSPRTVQAHLTHVYRKLGITSRVQLAQQAARHASGS
jgi:DNA-binding CsgD family transcriptional regulator